MKSIKWFDEYVVKLDHKGNNYKYHEIKDVYNADYEITLNELYTKYVRFHDIEYQDFYTDEDLSASLYRGASEMHYLTYCETHQIELTDEQYADFLEYLDGEEDYTPDDVEHWAWLNGLFDNIVTNDVNFSAILDDIREAWEEVRADREED